MPTGVQLCSRSTISAARPSWVTFRLPSTRPGAGAGAGPAPPFAGFGAGAGSLVAADWPAAAPAFDAVGPAVPAAAVIDCAPADCVPADCATEDGTWLPLLEFPG